MPGGYRHRPGRTLVPLRRTLDTPGNERGRRTVRVLPAAAAAAITTVLAAAALGAVPQPRLVSATVVGDRVNLTFSTQVAQPPVTAITVTVNGAVVRAARAVTSGRRVQLVLPAGVFGDDLVTVAGRNLRGRNRRLVRAFSLTAVNRSTPGCSVDTEG